MKMQSDSIIRAQHEHIVLGKRARSGTVSPSSHLVSEREPNFRSGRNVQPRLSQPDRSRNQRSRKSYDSTASNTSETSSAASESKGSKIALGATENAAASFSASSNTTPADEPAPDDSDEDTSSISSSSSSSSSSSGGDVSGNDSSNDYGNGVIASDSEDSSSTSRSDVIIHLSSTSKPNMDREQVLKEGEGLQYRLENFLPQMAAANSALHTSLKDGREDDYDIENIDDSKGNYIEMDLDMGVLEEIPSKAKDQLKEPMKEVDEQSNTSDERQDDEKDVIGNLLGHNKRKQFPIGIQEVS